MGLFLLAAIWMPNIIKVQLELSDFFCLIVGFKFNSWRAG